MLRSDLGTRTDVLDADCGDQLYFQRCRWCSTVMFRRLLCPVCSSTDLEAHRSEGVGIVYRAAVLNRNTPEMRTMATIHMAEGFTVRSRVLGSAPDVRPGARVCLAESTGGDRRELVFRLCDDPYAGIWH